MDKGISNINIANFFNNEKNEDLKKNYIGVVYSMDSITRYINFYEIMKKKKCYIPICSI